MNAKLLFRFILMGLMLSALVLAGCDDGDDGRDGRDGRDGVDGQDASSEVTDNLQDQVDTLTEDQQDLAGTVADLSGVGHPAELEKPVVSDIVVSRSATDELTVTFHVETSDGPLEGLGSAPSAAGDVRVYMADIVPAGTVTVNAPQTTWDTDFLEMWTAERGGRPETSTVTDLGGGDYSFQMTATPADIVGGDAPEGSLDHVQRVYVRADARDFEGLNRTMGVADFMMPAAGADTGVIDSTTRTIVVASACTACHNDPLQGAAHGGGYQSPQVCVMCHSPIGVYGDEMQELEAWSASLFHKIHAAIDMDAFPDRIDVDMNGDGEINELDADDDGEITDAELASPDREQFGYSAVKYPKNIQDCEVCHFDDGQDMADAWKTNPTIEACTSCHVETTFGNEATHSGGPLENNVSCVFCHGPGALWDTVVEHAIVDTTTYSTSIELEADADGDGVYEAGETPLITVTVTDAAGDPIAAYDGLNTTFTNANLYVYGPRATPVPVLTTNSTTDPVDPGVDQGRTMFTVIPSLIPGPVTPGNITPDEDGKPQIDPDTDNWTVNDDALVQTDATGFKYELQAIPDDLEPGTYMIMAYVTHIPSTPADEFYRNTVGKFGWQLMTFQVGTPTEELKVSGDGCLECHTDNSWGSMYHRGYFSVDGCIACHDKSGNYANQLGNRVHAVHSQNTWGDLLASGGMPEEDIWAEITYPQSVTYCTTCHSSGNTSYKTNMFTGACLGCHGEETGGVEAHMDLNTTEDGVSACIACHGEGKSAAIFD